MDETWDSIIVGGGAAGLSAALVLGRARKRTLVVDAGRQSNLPAHAVGGLLGFSGSPADLYAAGREQLAAHPTVELRDGEVVGGERDPSGFSLELADGSRERARRVLLAMGTDYRYPDLPGIAERWGRSVFHCPFCHGWEVREQALGVLDRGAEGARRALLLRSWSHDVTLFAGGPAELGPEEAAQLEAAGVAVDERRVAELRGPGDALTAIGFADGSERPCDALLVPVTIHQRSPLAEQLGAALREPGPVAAGAIDVDAMQHTREPGLLAAGDVSEQMPSVVNAMAAGSKAAAAIVASLMTEALEPAPAGG